MGPSLSVVHTVPSSRRKLAPALSSPPKQHRTVEQARREPLEADRHLAQPAAELLHDPVDHAAADQRLADRGPGRPVRAVREQVADGHGQEVVGVHQPSRGRDDAVPVRVGVVGEGHAGTDP